MPNARDKDKVMIGVWLHDEFAAALDQARGRDSRSEFARDAIAEKLLRDNGVIIPPEKRYPADRVGKGGPKTKYPASSSSPYVMNDKPVPPKRRKKGE